LQLALHQSFMPGVELQGGMATQEPPWRKKNMVAFLE
jgi:hypothetical protein